MSRCTASVVFADGDQIQVTATGATSYPDALSQLRHEAITGVVELVAELRVADVGEVSQALEDE